MSNEVLGWLLIIGGIYIAASGYFGVLAAIGGGWKLWLLVMGLLTMFGGCAGMVALGVSLL